MSPLRTSLATLALATSVVAQFQASNTTARRVGLQARELESGIANQPNLVTVHGPPGAAYFTMLHFAMFGWLGLALSLLVHEVEVHARHPRQVIVGLFVVLEGGFLVGANIFMPGVVEAIGFGRVVVGNLVTATAMAAFMMRSHNPEAWQRLMQGKPFV